jgi:outer membrane receptor protein involved in Fe transport
MNRQVRIRRSFLLTVAIVNVMVLSPHGVIHADDPPSPPPFSHASAPLSLSPYTLHLLRYSDIRHLPMRGTQSYLALHPGVVLLDGSLYVRGGRKNDLGYYLNGIPITNRYTGLEGLTVIPEAITQLALMSGPFGAQHGHANAGIVLTSLRTGGDELQFSLDYQTDDFAKPGEEFLGTSSFGFRNVVGTAGGSIDALDGLKFFIAGQHNFWRNRQTMYLDPFRFDLVVDQTDPRYNFFGPPVPLPYPVAFRKNAIPNNRAESNVIQGILTHTVEQFDLSFTGSYQWDERPEGTQWPFALTRYFNQRRIPTLETKTSFFALQASRQITDDITAAVSVSRYGRSAETLDPDFGGDWMKFVDSAANAAIGYTGFPRRYTHPSDMRYSTIYSFRFAHENAPNNSYLKENQSAWLFAASAEARIGDNWTARIGGDIELWTMRMFQVSSIWGALVDVFNTDGTPRQFSSPEERRATMGRFGYINNYGYDTDGNEASDGVDGLRTPVFASAYVHNQVKHEDLVLDLGLRLEHYDTKIRGPKDPLNPPFDANYIALLWSELVEQSSIQYLLPRLGLTYPVNKSTVLFASYGKYTQLPPLHLLYLGDLRLSRTLSSGWAGQPFNPPAPFFVRPERTTHYEAGLRQHINDRFLFSGTLFYKDIVDQIAYARFPEPGPASYVAYTNTDRATVKGLEVMVEMRKREGFSAKLHYTLSDAQGTGSHPNSNAGRVEQNISGDLILAPLDYGQTHRAYLFLDYGFGMDEAGHFLSGIRASLIASFASGHRYTQVQLPTFGGATNPWNNGVQSLVDPRAAHPTEPINQSSTPSAFVVDVRMGKEFSIGSVNLELYAVALNLFNTKQIVNLYPTTGSAQDDGWLGSNVASTLLTIPQYREFYQAINLQNRWAYMSATGNDIYGTPRQIRFGVSVTM